MRALAAMVLWAAGCNAVLGLDEPSRGDGGGGQVVDAAIDGDRDAAHDDDAGPTRVPGLVGVITRDYVNSAGVAMQSFAASIAFGPAPATCTELLATGACRVLRCAAVSVPVRPHAGPMAISSTVASVTTSATIVPDASGLYPFTDKVGRLFDGGAVVTVTASGGPLPAFAASSAAPASVQFTTDVPAPEDDPWVRNRTTPLPLVWTQGTTGDVEVVISSDTADQTINCAFAASAGAGVVPAVALAMLPAGAGRLAANVVTTSLQAVGPIDLVLRVAMVGRTSRGNIANGKLRLQ